MNYQESSSTTLDLRGNAGHESRYGSVREMCPEGTKLKCAPLFSEEI